MVISGPEIFTNGVTNTPKRESTYRFSFSKTTGGDRGSSLHKQPKGGGGIQGLLYTPNQGHRVSFKHTTEEGVQGLLTQATEGRIQGLLYTNNRRGETESPLPTCRGGRRAGMQLLHIQPGL